MKQLCGMQKDMLNNRLTRCPVNRLEELSWMLGVQTLQNNDHQSTNQNR